MGTFLTRLKAAVDERHRGYPSSVIVVQRADLCELLRHFQRLEDEDRRRYYEQQQMDRESTKKRTNRRS